MYAVIARRLIMLPVILLFAGFLIFLVPYLSGIDPAEAILRARVEERELTDQTIEQFRQKLGLVIESRPTQSGRTRPSKEPFAGRRLNPETPSAIHFISGLQSTAVWKDARNFRRRNTAAGTQPSPPFVRKTRGRF